MLVLAYVTRCLLLYVYIIVFKYFCRPQNIYLTFFHILNTFNVLFTHLQKFAVFHPNNSHQHPVSPSGLSTLYTAEKVEMGLGEKCC